MIRNIRGEPVKESYLEEGLDKRTNNEIKQQKEAMESVNWHVWERCNYKCKFCFATFPQIKNRLTRERALLIPTLLADAGIKKLNFVGGEPLLCPYIGELLSASRKAKLKTSIVTNASRLSRQFLETNSSNIDWIGISIDSANEDTEKSLGRGLGDHVGMAVSRAGMVKDFGIRLKVNTVVTSLNFKEDLTALISELGPDRWKVFQMLLIYGESVKTGKKLAINRDQFMEFVSRHKQLGPIVEDNDAMTGSYLMLDPMGRFFQNWGGHYVRSESVQDIGVQAAIDQVGWSHQKFMDRGGEYNW